MRWSYKGRSSNLEDRRGLSLGRTGTGVGLGGALLLLALSYVFNIDLVSIFSDSGAGYGNPPASSRSAPVTDAEEEPMVHFVSFVLDDAQQTWNRLLGPRYRDAKLVLFREAVRSGCGTAPAAAGPFYCPADQKVYIDLSFFDELNQRFGAPGDFARAYVLAHEIGHHVQNLLGIARGMGGAQRSNELSVPTELQADCLAGVWGHSTAQRDILERGDVEEALNAASAIGDDHLQRMSHGEVNPDTFTHGTSAQRVQWFRRGLEQGSIEACNTFQGL
jgi:predicted metalloprotease